ncbi:MAG: hypothetical protein NC548_64115 [Lachnospiraceae bacterium]|nr:hypothetical protein [Prevotella sp.]MCM1075328.1 hypothetical protein [Ruminococcus sp.]MCM1225376.1 hypothetical protein [Lachnospiraceae bacterium]
MKAKLTELVNTLYEAEGLVEMAIRRNANASDRVVDLIINKCGEMAELAQNLIVGRPVEEEVAEADTLPVYDSDEEVCRASAEEKEVEVFTTEILPKIPSRQDAPEMHDTEMFDDEPEDFYDSVPAEPTTSQPSRTDSGKKLFSLFSINDKFRFRRELFGGSDVQMRDTLSMLETLPDLDAAFKYCTEALGWKADNPEVKDFLSITQRYYL